MNGQSIEKLKVAQLNCSGHSNAGYIEFLIVY